MGTDSQADSHPPDELAADDFWSLYRARAPLIEESLLAALRPFSPALAERRAADRRLDLAEAALRKEASDCAALGIPLAAWFEESRLSIDLLLPFISSPPMAAALHRLASRRLETISEAYLARKEAALAEAQVALETSQSRSRAVFDDSPLPIWVYERGTRRILEVNHAAARHYGYSVEEFRQLTVPDLWLEEDRERVLKLTTNPPPHSVVVARQRKKDGSAFWVESYGSDFPAAGPSARVAVIKDISAERAAEQARRRVETRFARLSDSGAIGIIITNREWKAVEVNDALAIMLGFSRQELISGEVDWRGLTPPRWAEVDRVAIEQLLGTGFAGLREKEYRRKDGTLCPVLIATAMVDGQETISFVIDLTVRKQIEAANEELRRAREAEERELTARQAREEALRAANAALEVSAEQLRSLNGELEASAEQLRAVNAELETFSYSVAHDLRAPLRALNGFAQILLEDWGDKLDGEARESLDKIKEAALKMGSLIDALLGLSRLTRGALRPERVDLSAQARAVAAQLAAQEPARQTTFVIEDGLSADADPDLLRAVFDNLLGNAWKFTSKVPAARIELGATAGEGAPVFFIRDNGAGFDVAYASRLFGPFQRLHREVDFPGTGVGLATVQRIVRRHGGRIWAEGVVNGGATFYFTLPGAE